MSEMAPEEGGSVLSRRIMGIPAWVILLVVVVLAYMFFRNKSGASNSQPAGATTSGNAPQTTGDITVDPSATTINVQAPYSNQQSSSVTQNPPRHATPNPQPTPAPPPVKKTHVTQVKKPPVPAVPKAASVTVAKWTARNTPWNSTLTGIAVHEHTTVAKLLQLNPQVKNPNVLTPGQKIMI